MRLKSTYSIANTVRLFVLGAAFTLGTLRGSAQITVTATAGTLGPTVYTQLRLAFAAINAGTHQGAINISVTANTTETAVGTLNRSGSGAANYTSILVKPAPGVTATITSNIAGNGPIYFYGANNVTIDGSNTPGGTTQNLTIRNTNAGLGYVIRMGSPSAAFGVSNVTVKNCVITGGSVNNGIAITSGSGTTLYQNGECLSSNITIQNNVISGAQLGIYSFGPSYASLTTLDNNWNISGNNVNTCGLGGIWLNSTQNFSIAGNTVTNIGGIPAGTFAAGTAFTTGIVLSFYVAGGSVNNNQVNNVSDAATDGSYGFYFDYISSGGTTQVYDNYVADIKARAAGIATATNATMGYGIYMDYGANVNFFENSIDQSVNSNPTGGAVAIAISNFAAICFNPFAAGGITGGVAVVNNILVNTESTGNPYGIISTAPASIFSSIDYNDYFVSSAAGNLGNVGLVNCNTLAAMQANFGGNLNSITPYGPSWVSTTNLDLNTVPANNVLNAGTFATVPSITTDIHGTTRITPTIGAYELILCPPAITGTPIVCQGATTSLTDATAGGTWSSTVAGVATVSATGVVTGLSGGTTTISYVIGTCGVAQVVTVNPATPVLGTLLLCQGATTTLTDATTPGTWSSSTAGVATIVTGSGFLTAAGVGTSTITYTTSLGCPSTAVVTVTPLPTAILGTLSVCSGATTLLTDAVGGGGWTSSNPAVASVGAGTGLVSGFGTVMANAVITYTLGTCSVSATVTVNPSPGAITGTPNVCVGLTTNLTDAVAGGTWSSSNTGVATVSGTGVVTGVGIGGIATITYTLPGNCYVTTPVTVNPAPSAIQGNPVVCQGSTTLLSDLVGGGAWSSSAPGIASIDPVTGLVSALAPGTTIITYSDLNCTPVSVVVTVNPVAPINGTVVLCAGLTTSLTDALTGGTWTSSLPAIAAVGISTGVVTAYSAGNTTVVYTNTYNCPATVVVTVNTSPVAIVGNFNLCVGLSNLLTDPTAGGAWSSSAPGIASIDPVTGLASGMATGTATITYTLPIGSCTATSNVTVNPVPGGINGTTSGCIGFSTTLTDATAGGTWSSSNTGVATIGSLSGLVSALSAGTTTIIYTIPGSGCNANTVFTVNPPPAAISGTSPICQGSSSLFNDSSPGGTWSSSNPATATVDPTGLVTGVTSGTATITYTLPTTCFRIYATTITPAPTAINGSSTVCVGGATMLTDLITGGTWSIASGSGSASISPSTGIVTGLTPGSVIAMYSTCSTVSFPMLVNPLPSAILGVGSICQGTSTTVSDATPGGTWSASAGGTISPTGVVTGLSPLTGVTVTYTIPTGCYVTAPIAVSPAPGPILGVDSVCPASSVILSDATPGGVWSSSDGTIAHAIAFTGEVDGVVQGDVTISYTLISGCYTVTPFHVETPIPVFLSVAPSPADSFLCHNTPVTLTATVTPVVGTPSFVWELFGSYIGAGNPYTYNPTHGDFLTCVMTVSGACVTPSVVSKDVTLNVWPQGGPVVVLTYTQPDTASYLGEVYTFYTTVTFGGPSPTYQWYVNNAPIGGATGPVFTTHIYDENDSVYCVVNGNSPCDTGSYNGTSNTAIIYGQGWLSVHNVQAGSNDLTLFPNPNTGSFTLSGTVGAGQDKEVELEVMDMLGRTVYAGKTMPQNGTVKADIKLDNEAAGSYLLRVNTETGTQTFHFVIR